MHTTWKTALWQQFGAAIDMLQRAIDACPDDLWSDGSQRQEFWYVAFHALFFLDLYLSESDKGFAPPSPFTLDELDERGLMPERVYTKEELLSYLEHGRKKCRTVIAALTEADAQNTCGISWLDLSFAGLLLYNLRHVQHHAGQLQMMIGRKTGSSPRWVRKTESSLFSA